MSSYGETYLKIQASILERFPERKCEIIAVSKTKPYEVIREAYLSGIRIFGENYIPEAIEKFTRLRLEFPEAASSVILHHIGPVQSGTLRKLFGVFQYTHGVGSFSSLSELVKRAEKEKIKIRFLLQINLTDEATKHGFLISDIIAGRNELARLTNEYCFFVGFMGMGPSDGNEIRTRDAFQRLQALRDEYFPEKKLSIGMSGDYLWAMEFGADYLRIGSLIFGSRK